MLALSDQHSGACAKNVNMQTASAFGLASSWNAFPGGEAIQLFLSGKTERFSLGMMDFMNIQKL